MRRSLYGFSNLIDFSTTLVVMLTFGIAGCQNSFTIKVERVLVDPKLEGVQNSSRLGTALTDAIRGLSAIRESYKKIQNAISDGNATLETPTSSVHGQLQTAYVAAADAINVVSNQITELKELLDKPWPIESSSIAKNAKNKNASTSASSKTGAQNNEPDDVAALKERVIWALRRAEALSIVEAARAQSLQKALQAATKGAASPFKDAFKFEFEKVQAIALQLQNRMASVGFGGFRQLGVYEINLSDPNYRLLFGADEEDKPAKVSTSPVSLVQVDASGDSSIMVIAESPGQYRLYQLTNDPTQLARNIALIVQKITVAALKFATAGL